MHLGKWPNWRSFLFTLIFQVGVPLLPLAIEHWLANIEMRSLFLVAMLYPLCLAAASREFIFFVAGTLIGLFAGISFGVTVAGNPPPDFAAETATLTILFSAVAFALGSAKTHFVDGEMALKFGFSQPANGAS